MLILSLVIIAAVIVIDQVTKQLAVVHLMPIRDFPLIEDVLHLTYSENRGAAFSMLENHRWVFLITSTVAIVVILVGMIIYRKKLNLPLAVSLSFIVGGGIGNMIDRLALGYVVDFINVELINFAIFNAADSFICVGAAIMLIYMIFFDGKNEKVSETKDGRSNQSEKQ
ncbi:MAG: signal peptidase II [Clostridia bacterium]|nr:signal peptidase II [Clostridia bacterium]MBQ4574785.1 signal peptidase II [Clostridia bacterium]